MRRPSAGWLGVLVGATFALLLLVADHAGAQVAVSATAHGGMASGTNTTTLTSTSAVTFSTGDVVGISVFASASGLNATTYTATCTGLTFTEHAVVNNATQRLALVAAVASAGGSCTPAVTTAAGLTLDGGSLRVFTLTGADVSSGLVSALPQSASINESFATTTHVMTLGAFEDTGNATLGLFADSTNSTWTEGSGFSIVSQASHTSPTYSNMVEFTANDDTTVDATDSNSGHATYALAFEVAAAVGDTPPTTTTTTAPTTTTVPGGGGGGLSCTVEDECVVSLDEDTSEFLVAAACVVVFLASASLVGSWRRA